MGRFWQVVVHGQKYLGRNSTCCTHLCLERSPRAFLFQELCSSFQQLKIMKRVSKLANILYRYLHSLKILWGKMAWFRKFKTGKTRRINDKGCISLEIIWNEYNMRHLSIWYPIYAVTLAEDLSKKLAPKKPSLEWKTVVFLSQIIIKYFLKKCQYKVRCAWKLSVWIIQFSPT